jgi:predicted transcriptional regulator
MKEITITDKKKEIIKMLKKGEHSTTEISRIIGFDYYKTAEILTSLEKENKIIKTEVNKFTFWRIKDESKIKV